jgi:hypothetical protein
VPARSALPTSSVVKSACVRIARSSVERPTEKHEHTENRHFSRPDQNASHAR